MGLTARVYSLATVENMEESKDFVAKIFNRTNTNYFLHEQEIINKIVQRAQRAKCQDSQNNDDPTSLIEGV